MPPRLERELIVPPVDPEGDQTPGYHKDGTPITTGDPDTPQEAGEAIVIGSVRRRRIGLEVKGISPTQPRRGEIIVSRDENGQMRARRYRPKNHGDGPLVALDYSEALAQIDSADERRSFRATAMHERHTNLHNLTPASPSPEGRRATLDLGGFFTNVGAEYAQSPDAPSDEPQENVDDEPKIPWK